MPRNFIQKCFTHWLDKNTSRFNHPPCNIQYKYGGIQFNLQGIIPEMSWGVRYNSVMLYISYKDNDFWDAVGECDIYENKSINGLYYCELCAFPHDYMEAGCKTSIYHTRQELWEDHCFETLLSISNERTKPDLWLCFLGNDGYTEARVRPKEILEGIKKNEYFIDAKKILCT